MKYKMNKYERHAYLYSSWVALLVPLISVVYYLSSYFYIDYKGPLAFIKVFFATAFPTTIGFAAVGFFFRDIFRQTSKQLFQFKLFKEDETKMPTTEMLLYKNKMLSRQRIKQLSEKLKIEYNVSLPTEEEQENDEEESRRRIVDAVGLMRAATRGDNILVQANYRYGFRRNMLGGLVWAMLVQIVLLLFILYKSVNVSPCLVGILLTIGLFLIGWSSLKPAARNYARTLFNSFLSLSK
ncbi:hypothetical protein [Prevotella sp. AGR2160]|uniref:hypothetical protein n=1 Tax=Prevotella sp. AGR2160 TaxID=1280674 RepID=UPI00048F262B|nr:hypothetical protein [Prevotella sp. AGR2160]